MCVRASQLSNVIKPFVWDDSLSKQEDNSDFFLSYLICLTHLCLVKCSVLIISNLRVVG